MENINLNLAGNIVLLYGTITLLAVIFIGMTHCKEKRLDWSILFIAVFTAGIFSVSNLFGYIEETYTGFALIFSRQGAIDLISLFVLHPVLSTVFWTIDKYALARIKSGASVRTACLAASMVIAERINDVKLAAKDVRQLNFLEDAEEGELEV